jgi:c-di-GMP-related signal transduction protein
LQKFLARQPIFTSDRVVYGYELLFRASLENFFSNSQGDVASAAIAENFFLFGMEHLTQGRRAFINCTRDFLVRDYPALLPKDHVVIEILETVRPHEQVVEACRRLKAAGYLIALDDFLYTPEWLPLISLADFIKVDVLATAPEEQQRLAKEFTRTNTRLLAEKVETYEIFQRTMDWGYTYFQGYFFSRPEVLTRHDVPAYKLNYLRVLQAVNRAAIDLDEVAERIKAEASLSYRLLRYLNSAAFFLVSDVHSIPHALRLLGERGIRQWISLVAIACMGEDKPQELIVVSLTRARFCELLGPAARMPDSSNALFLLGLLSSIDAILDMTMEDVLREIVIHEEIRGALLGKDNSLRKIYDLAMMYETGSWDRLDESAARLGIPEDVIPGTFIQSVDWAKEILTGH